MNGHIGDVGREEDPLLNGADSISAVWAFHGSDSDMLHLRDFMRFEDPAGPSHAGLDESSSCWASAGLELSQPLAPGGSDMASLMLPSFSCAEAHDRSMGLIEPVTSPFVAASSSVQLLPPPPPPPPPQQQQQQQQQPLSIESIPVYHRSASEELAAELGNRLDARILEFLSLMGVRDCRSLMTCAAQTALGQRETKRIDVKVTKALLELRANTVTMFGNRYFGSPVSSNTIMCNLLVESLEKFFLDKLKAMACKCWGLLHFRCPFPDARTKAKLSEYSDRTSRQVSDWFTNWRARSWKPAFLKARRRLLKIMYVVFAGVVLRRHFQRLASPSRSFV